MVVDLVKNLAKSDQKLGKDQTDDHVYRLSDFAIALTVGFSHLRVMWKRKLWVLSWVEQFASNRDLSFGESVSKSLIYEFANDVTDHDMTFLYPLSVV